MNKKIIYIDFEAITENYLSPLGIKKIHDLPFMYTIGHYNKNNKFITKTSFFKFDKLVKKVNEQNKANWPYIKEHIVNSINTLIHENWTAQKLENQIDFAGWNPGLEKKILTEYCKFDNSVFNVITHKTPIALDKVIPKNLFLKKQNTDYFSYTKPFLSQMGIHKLQIDKSGNIAAFLGSVLLGSTIRSSYIFKKLRKTGDNLEFQKVRQELIKYNLDDVLKLDFYEQNKQKLTKLIDEQDELVGPIKLQRKKFNKVILDIAKQFRLENFKKFHKAYLDKFKNLDSSNLIKKIQSVFDTFKLNTEFLLSFQQNYLGSNLEIISQGLVTFLEKVKNIGDDVLLEQITESQLQPIEVVILKNVIALEIKNTNPNFFKITDILNKRIKAFNQFESYLKNNFKLNTVLEVKNMMLTIGSVLEFIQENDYQNGFASLKNDFIEFTKNTRDENKLKIELLNKEEEKVVFNLFKKYLNISIK
ncbi:hypothetical protein [Mycoplasmopsis gallinacea]|uniref:DUF2779 domain-containing protein n=1 Tax=Mycoplasmopsis gallinacea TaxID=29556 RepID=A0A6H0V3T9_9BACT|nr:hypothetical protein [Mycoplasmopsis gallinacea]QIW62136.1 hypothetical protein GOQ20_01615 [Mycoplasmopsis gallinacea]